VGRGRVPSPADYGEWRSLRQRGPGHSPGRKRVLVHLELETTHLMETDFVFFGNAYLTSHIHILLNIKLHCIVHIIQLKRLSILFTPLCVLDPSGYAKSLVHTVDYSCRPYSHRSRRHIAYIV